jgi:hypothetical protein
MDCDKRSVEATYVKATIYISPYALIGRPSLRAADNSARPNKVLASAKPWSEIAGRLGCWPAAQAILRGWVG